MRSPYVLPTRDVGHEHSRSHDILYLGTSPVQRGFNVSQRLFRLFVHVSVAHDVAVSVRRSCAGYVNVRSNAHSAGIANSCLPRRAASKVFSLHDAPPLQHSMAMIADEPRRS
jgi:hypothetical protein